MEFRAAGQSNGRRRRVRTDDATAGGVTVAGNGGAGTRRTKRERYASDGRPDRQPRVLDLVPRRRLAQSLCALVGGLLVAALLAIDWGLKHSATAWPEGVVRTFDVCGGASIAAWLRSGMLLAAAVFCLLIYVVRRHRTDDYRGGYRIWLWAAAWMTAMSIDAVARLRDACVAVGVAESHWTGPAGGALWWVAPCALAALTIGLRLALDMRECRLSTSLLIAASALWTAGEAVWTIAIGGSATSGATTDGGHVVARAPLIAAGLGMAGQWLLVVSLNWHARYVVLDASGELRAKKKRRGAKATDAEIAQGASSAAAANSNSSESAERDMTKISARDVRTPSQTADTRPAAEISKPTIAASTTASRVGNQPLGKPSSGGGSQQSSSNKQAETNKNDRSPTPTLTFGGRATVEPQKLSKAERKQMRRAA